MSFPASYPETPLIQPVPRRQDTPVNPDAFESSWGSSSSSAGCPCCATPPMPYPAPPTNISPSIELGSGSFAALEDQFLQTLTIQSTSLFHAQAVAVVPNDRRAAGHWLLVELLCHRAFATFGAQNSIRKFSTFHHQRFVPGDTLFIIVRRVNQGWLTWLEADITRSDMLVASATGLYDGPLLQPDDLRREPDGLAHGFGGLTTFYAPDQSPNETV
ncbi:uncharacterized protein LDX57_007766 [Aspergillus melleus]|uniref:uncharacterized protein n=1 Tax=Aspergillus melleus TaxID=138277 RepID=UPI001E8E33E3|nr:uncharacterized protein LDX57_007766 [Aspergillus melleus]KAH8430096.1 hypothetical protein LDX57_007766 [Aspergillus melleus]